MGDRVRHRRSRRVALLALPLVLLIQGVPAHASWTVTARPPLASTFSAGRCDLAPGAWAAPEDATPLCVWSAAPVASTGRSALHLKLSAVVNGSTFGVAGYSVRIAMPSASPNVTFTVAVRVPTNSRAGTGVGWTSSLMMGAAVARPDCSDVTDACRYPTEWKAFSGTTVSDTLVFRNGPYPGGVATIWVWTLAQLRVGGPPCVSTSCAAIGVPGAGAIDAAYATEITSVTARG